ncbi:MAG: DUF1002 domain-containing protein [Oscillospiraceae bacterium]|nr:DUF1002 domain-containing protein [Oscillospiraceae bacterium]
MEKWMKPISILLALLLIVGLGAPALAIEVGEQRVVVGADLSYEQRAQVYADFGLVRGVVPEMTVTIAEERAYLQGLVPDSVIGSRSISSIYIMTTRPGSGLDITINNINWLTREIYVNALVTAGITDARVIITAPVPVSGTAALTGIYKAFEDITGEPLPEEAKRIAVEEAVITGQIADALGDSEDIAALINQLKLIMDEIRTMSDDEVRDEIRNLADQLDMTLTADQVEQILRLARSLQNLDLGALQGTLEAIAGNMGRLSDLAQSAGGFIAGVTDFFSSVGSFFGAIGNFFSNLFG